MRLSRFVVALISTGIAVTVLSITAMCAESTVSGKTTSIAAFKNGLGFFIREGEATLKDGWAVTDVVPNAALGTYWIGSPKPEIMIERLISTQEEVFRTSPAVNISELIDANVGKKVRIQQGDKVIEGKLVSVAEDRKLDPNAPTYPVYTLVMQPQMGSYVTIETSTGTMVIDKYLIRQIEFEGGISTDHKITEKIKQFKFKVSGAKGNKAPVTIGYMQKGISWSPAYMVDLLDDKNARITMQGLLMNDVEDINGTDVNFVVGYPNFVFSDQLSPLALTQSINDFVQGVERSDNRNYASNIMSQSASMSRSAYGSGGYGGGYSGDSVSAPQTDFGYSTTKDTPGANEEDLFLYQMKDVNLKKGERAYYTVFSADVPYKHIYEWLVRDTSGIDTNGYMSSQNRSDTPRPEDQVWHKLRLTNNSKYPWTTAPAMTMSKGNPLSQDTLNYAAKGSTGELKVTVATDISASKSEEEKSREMGALKTSNNTYNKVTSEGTLTIKNYKSQPVTVSVKKTLVGEVTGTSDDGKVTKQAQGINAVNPTSTINWEIPLKPGEEKKVTYNYFVYFHY